MASQRLDQDAFGSAVTVKGTSNLITALSMPILASKISPSAVTMPPCHAIPTYVTMSCTLMSVYVPLRKTLADLPFTIYCMCIAFIEINSTLNK